MGRGRGTSVSECGCGWVCRGMSMEVWGQLLVSSPFSLYVSGSKFVTILLAWEPPGALLSLSLLWLGALRIQEYILRPKFTWIWGVKRPWWPGKSFTTELSAEPSGQCSLASYLMVYLSFLINKCMHVCVRAVWVCECTQKSVWPF